MVDNALPGLPSGKAVERVGPQVVEITTARLEQARQAEVVIREAAKVAGELRKVVEERGWCQRFGAGEHLTIEAWQFIGRFFEVAVRVDSCEFIEIKGDHGFKAVAMAVHAGTGNVLSRAEGLCMTDEPTWKKRAHRERAGMAQTRACSRALSNLFRSVADMAGYAGTPLDDVPEAPPMDEFTQPPPQKQAKPQPRISVDQAQDMRSLALDLHGTRAASITGEVLKKFGYRVTSEVLAKDYKAVMKALEETRP